jgi:hypothetical protein
MFDYGHNFSFYLLSQLLEKTSVSSEVRLYYHLCFAGSCHGMQIPDSSPLQSSFLPNHLWKPQE